MAMDPFTQMLSRQLAEDSAEVTRSLDQFMTERMSVLRAQERALHAYDEEMADIGDEIVSSAADDAVDHNLLRHLNATRTAALSDDYDEFESARDELEVQRSMERKPKKDKIEFDKGLEPKPDMPDPTEKAALRDEMFELLDMSRMEEMKLELEYEKLKADLGLKRAEYAADSLLNLQKANYGKLMDLFKVYQPQAFGKNWGNDADYIVMATELENMIKRFDKSRD